MGWAALAAAAVGAMAGGQKDVTSSNMQTVGSQATHLQDFNDMSQGQSGLEAQGYQGNISNLTLMQQLTNAGPGIEDINAANQANNQYGNILQGYLNNGGMPSYTQIGQANNYANAMFAPQQTALNQQFYDANIQNQRLAARLGRPGNDPILQNKLMMEQTRQQSMLNSQRGAFAAQYADQLPQRQFDAASALANLRSNLASQAFNNRSTMLQMGQQLVNNERNYRLGGALHTSYGDQAGEMASGGGFKGAVTGAFAGAGSVMGGMGNMGGKPGG